MKWWILAAVILIVVGWFPLLGLAGVLPLYLGAPLYEIFFGSGSFERTQSTLGDNTWPMLLILTTVWPIFLPISFFLTRRFCCTSNYSKFTFPFFLVCFVLSLSVVGFLGLLLFSRE
jgi:hypothetical protein